MVIKRVLVEYTKHCKGEGFVSRQQVKCPLEHSSSKAEERGFPGDAVVGNLPANAGDTGSSPGLGGSHMPRGDWVREPQLLSLRDRKSVV